jgi:hypothetical protein
MHEQEDSSADPKLISTRAMDIAVAMLFLAAAGIVIYDSVRLGFGWQENVGPGAGYFPFYIALILAAASLVNLFRAVADRNGAAKVFVTRASLARVFAVLLPLAVFVVAIGYIGIYVSSAAFITLFMMYFGRYGPHKALPVGAAVSVALFFLFEKWFLVPLPKGPLEAYLGY